MSIQEQIQQLESDPQELAEEVVRSTYPGPDNDTFKTGLRNAFTVFPVVVEDLNDWFYPVDVRVHDEEHVAMPMRYRWTIIRWAESQMDSWLERNGWEDFAHLNADTRKRRNDELEARYRKQYGGVTVDCNFLVYMPPEVFEALNERSDTNMAERQRRQEKKQNTLEEVVAARRANNEQ